MIHVLKNVLVSVVVMIGACVRPGLVIVMIIVMRMLVALVTHATGFIGLAPLKDTVGPIIVSTISVQAFVLLANVLEVLVWFLVFLIGPAPVGRPLPQP